MTLTPCAKTLSGVLCEGPDSPLDVGFFFNHHHFFFTFLIVPFALCIILNELNYVSSVALLFDLLVSHRPTVEM